MRGDVPNFRAITPKSLVDALKLLREQNDCVPLAGGTDLMVLFEAGHLEKKTYLNLWPLAELRGIKVTAETIDIMALTTYSQIQAEPVLRQEFPNLCAAGYVTGGRAIQNRGTLGGNIANASPAADSPPAILVYDAKLEIVSANGATWMEYADFHLGYKKMQKRPEELIRTIRLPRKAGKRQHYYRKVGTRKAQAISKIVMAAVAGNHQGKLTDVRIAFGSVAPTTIRCRQLEGFLNEKPLKKLPISEARAILAKEIAPIADIRSTKEFRLTVSLNLLEEFLLELQKES
jgi:CO/xanthine dehydrogenase FAD-binding subunit